MPSEHDNRRALPTPEIEVARRRHGPLEEIELLIRRSGLPRPMPVSVYRVGDTLIDSGSPHAAPYLVEALRGRPPRRVLLTHQHEDHVGGITALRRAFGDIPVYAPRPHIELLSDPQTVPPYRVLAWGQPDPIEGPIPIDPGDHFEADGHVLEALPTPGHTPGHLAFALRNDERATVLTGDLYLGRHPTGAWYESALDDMRDSARRLAGTAPSVTLCPSHGPVRQEGRRRLLDLADWLENQIEAVHRLAESLGTRDYGVIARAYLGREDDLATLSKGEFSHVCFVRAILDPVRTLPAEVPE